MTDKRKAFHAAGERFAREHGEILEGLANGPPPTFAGTAYRVRDGAPEHRPPGAATWRPMRRRDLLALPVTSEAWRWLRAQGVARPSPSGPRAPWAERAPVQRTTERLTLSLPPAVIATIRERAEAAGLTVSAYVARELGL